VCWGDRAGEPGTIEGDAQGCEDLLSAAFVAVSFGESYCLDVADDAFATSFVESGVECASHIAGVVGLEPLNDRVVGPAH